MRPTIYIICAALLLAIVGCDKSTEATKGASGLSESPPGESSSPSTAAPGPWRIGTIDVRAGESAGEVELPSSESVSKWLTATIREVDALEKTEEEASAFLMYQAAVVDGVSGVPSDEQPFLRVRVQGRLEDPTRPDSVNNLMALGLSRDLQFEAGDGAPSATTVQTSVRQVVEEYVRIVARRFEALSGTETQLVALLESEELPAEAALTAIHEARDRKVDEAAPAVAELLGHDSPDVVVAAAGALAKMAPEKTAGQIVDAAGRLGRERKYASLHQLIFIVGDLDQPVAREYLDGLRGHQIPDIRRAATQALDSGVSDDDRGQP
ncbi:MAG: hypothetical protein ACQEVA_00460 [Myxococcota bacterium]